MNNSSTVNWGFTYEIVCKDPEGNVKWTETRHNIVPTVALNHVIDVVLRNQTQVATWYVGLTSGTPTVDSANTMASHAGWTEVTAYSESVRQTLTLAAASSGSSSNTASKASYSINADSTTIGGAFIASDSTKSGTSGTLFSVAAFTGGDKAADNGDTLEVTATITAADDGA